MSTDRLHINADGTGATFRRVTPTSPTAIVKVRAGYYETRDYRYATYSYRSSGYTYWIVIHRVGDEMTAIGDVCPTLASAKRVIAELIAADVAA